MTSGAPLPASNDLVRRAPADVLDVFCRAVLEAAGADAPTVDAAARAMMHGSRLGVDSHGVRLLHHYVTALTGGRVNATPEMSFANEAGALCRLDADSGHGALAAFTAMDHAVRSARTLGLCAVAIHNSSHFGPAGAFALAAANAGCIGVAMCNSDAVVRLHDGAAPVHGTNPIAAAAPAGGSRPWLLDMATSSIPFNRVHLFRSLGQDLPAATASAADGRDTRNAGDAEMLAPLGGEFAFKGAGLAGLVEIFTAMLSGAKLSSEIAPMSGPDFLRPRDVGAFVMAICPDVLGPAGRFETDMRRYLDTLRASPAREGAGVMAPGDREWAEADRREADGIPLDPETVRLFRDLASRFSLSMPGEGGHGD